MDNQHQLITGYRDLDQDEIDLINDIKAHAEACRVLAQQLRDRLSPDQRWVSIGETQLQQGFMALTRAVAKPTTY